MTVQTQRTIDEVQALLAKKAERVLLCEAFADHLEAEGGLCATLASAFRTGTDEVGHA